MVRSTHNEPIAKASFPVCLASPRSLAFIIALTLLSLFGVSHQLAAQAPDNLVPLVFGVSPTEETDTLKSRFAPLVSYLQGRLGRPVRLEIAKSPLTQVVRTGIGRIDIAYLEVEEYLHLTQRYGVRPILAGLSLDKGAGIKGVIVTAKDSPIITLRDLQDTDVAFGDVNSATGYLLAHMALTQANVTVKEHHLAKQPNIAYGILAGNFAAGAINERVFRQFADRGLRLLMTLPASPPPVFVSNPKLPSALQVEIRATFQEIGAAPGSLEVLRAIDRNADGLIPITDNDYDAIRQLQKGAAAAGGDR